MIATSHDESVTTSESGLAAAAWSLRNAAFQHDGAAHRAVDDVSLAIECGQMTAVLGPNGAGKSTLLQLLLGTLTPSAGQVAFRERPVALWPRATLARAIGVVPQGEAEPMFTVRDVVAMGRYPRLGPWQRERAEDADAIARAMDRCDVARFADRWLSTLSGGERQRVRLARALAQDAPVLVLDEPTAFLDIRHEMTTFELLRDLRDEGTTVVVATHNLNLAARYADALLLLDRGRLSAIGAPGAVLTAERVERVYEWPVSIVADDAGAPQIVPRDSRHR
jgi:iron complex transport system ATP-binding protein